MISSSCANNHDVRTLEVDGIFWNIKNEYLKKRAWIFQEINEPLSCASKVTLWFWINTTTIWKSVDQTS